MTTMTTPPLAALSVPATPSTPLAPIQVSHTTPDGLTATITVPPSHPAHSSLYNFLSGLWGFARPIAEQVVVEAVVAKMQPVQPIAAPPVPPTPPSA